MNRKPTLRRHCNFISPSLALLASLIVSAGVRAGLTGVVNGDFEAQRAEYDAGSGYLNGVTGWYDSWTNFGYDTFVGSSNTTREGDRPGDWPSLANWGPTWDSTMRLGMSGQFFMPGDTIPPDAGKAWIYQQIGTYDHGMGTITVEFDAIRRLNRFYTGGWNTLQVQLWTGGNPALAADGTGDGDYGVGLVDIGATQRAMKQFAAADIAYVNPVTGVAATFAVLPSEPAMAHVTANLDIVGAAEGEPIWLQIYALNEGTIDTLATPTHRPAEAYLDNIVVSGGTVFKLNIANHGSTLDFHWLSRSGSRYNLRCSPDLSTPPATWPLAQENIAATPPLNLLSLALPADPRMFYVVEEYSAPQLTVYSEDFDGPVTGWTSGYDAADTGHNTAWQLGTPTNVGPLAANSPPNCYGTNINTNYGFNSNIWLHSPPIDLTAYTSGTLQFARFINVEGNPFDYGTISILSAATGVALAVLDPDVEGHSSAWETYSKPLPAAAFSQPIKLEFHLKSDDWDSAGPYAGWYIDDIVIKASGS